MPNTRLSLTKPTFGHPSKGQKTPAETRQNAHRTLVLRKYEEKRLRLLDGKEITLCGYENPFDPFFASLCGSIGSLLWIVGLVLYLSVHPELTSLQAASFLDKVTAVEPGCRYTNVSFVNKASSIQYHSSGGIDDSGYADVMRHFCRQTAFLAIEYPAKYGIVSNTPIMTNPSTGPWWVIRGGSSGALSGLETLTFQTTEAMHSNGEEQCVYAKTPSWGGDKAPDMTTNWQTQKGVTQCSLKETDDVCQLYPPTATWSTELMPCWVGIVKKGMDASTIFPSCNDAGKGCMLLDSPNTTLATLVNEKQKLVTNGLILVGVGGVLHVLVFVLSYFLCWTKSEKWLSPCSANRNRSSERRGFWPEPAIGTCGTVICWWCCTLAAGKMIDGCNKDRKKKTASHGQTTKTPQECTPTKAPTVTVTIKM